jgi:hypothetical protein
LNPPLAARPFDHVTKLRQRAAEWLKVAPRNVVRNTDVNNSQYRQVITRFGSAEQTIYEGDA